jgi:RHH-type proline utilization regulon transcriptional repressor/proline dehydrogenase/delta 1-pyrroline-5-carboxylate dehydrogenase
MLAAKPTLRLLAETGGKNATIVTGLADRDQAIKNVVHSAFGHSGQKCSATSLLVLEAEVYDDPKFKRALCDAVQSLAVGSAWDLKTRIGPLIRKPEGVLETALKELEHHESWAVMPHRDPANPALYSPAVKWGVQPGSFTHLTEFFGPVLGVMRAQNLHEAIEFVNQTGYGLTSGIETLDDREREIWRESVRAGNLYINRGTTGAIVLRQPFGGTGKSAFGPGIKAGGPNYVATLMRFRDTEFAAPEWELNDRDVAQLFAALRTGDTGNPCDAVEARRIHHAAQSYQHYYREEFGTPHDHFRLVGQDNIRRYLPVRELRIRVHEADTAFDVIARICAAKIAGCRITLSTQPHLENAVVDWLDEATEGWAATIEFVEETDEQLADVIRQGHTLRVRYADPSRVPVTIREAAATTGLYVADAPVLAHGRVELLWYFAEQSISDNYHRYGNLGGRADEARADVY